jgi:predicted phosphodiesterase
MTTKWKSPQLEDVVVAHISDLHLGAPKSNETWKLVSKFLIESVKPQLVIVTGDLVDTPDEALYDDARTKLDALNVQYFVCPGNHDRHYRGNRFRWLKFLNPGPVGALMDQKFGDRLLHPGNPRSLELGSQNNKWKVGLFGVDSSLNADYSARGHVESDIFDVIRSATKSQDWDLSIFAIHHHLLSVRELERSRQGSLSDLANLTCLLNSGSLLEVLANSRVDIVLHGHEHAHNWGVYGTLADGQPRVKVIGAGSVTGNKTGHGAAEERISLNLLCLSPQKVGTLQRIVRNPVEWAVVDQVTLFDGVDVRRSWLSRMYPGEPLNREVVKYVQFTRERDVFVRWLFTRWPITGSSFSHPVTSWNGELDRQSLCAAMRTAEGHELVIGYPEVRSEAKANARHDISFDVPHSHQNTPLTIELSYRWVAAATLTAAELEALQDEVAVEPLREAGYEFSTIWAPAPLAAAQIIISLPPEFSPNTVDVQVSQDPGQEQCPSEAAELKPTVRVLAAGSYSLRIPYPRTNRDYTLVWRPVQAAAVSEAPETERYLQVIRAQATNLLDSFCGILSDSALSGASVTLYVEAAKPSMMQNIASRRVGPDQSVQSALPAYYDLRKLSVVSLAWRGALTEVRERPHDFEAAIELGFVDSEEGLVCVPLRFSFGWTNPPPLAVIRIGVSRGAEQKLLSENSNAKLWALLSAASTAMLSRLFREV